MAIRRDDNVQRSSTAPPYAWRSLLFIALLAVLSPGCASYQFGNRSLFRADIRTVHVPMFESDSLRRGMSEELTEAIVKELEGRAYKVSSSLNADSVLSGRIVSESKRLIAENQFDEARNLEFNLLIQVSWIDRRTGTMLMENLSVPITHIPLSVSSSSSFVPEGGQSFATARQRAIQKAAQQIVDQMEVRW